MKLFISLVFVLVLAVTGIFAQPQDHIWSPVYPFPQDTVISGVEYGIYFTTPGLAFWQRDEVSSNIDLQFVEFSSWAYLAPVDVFTLSGVAGWNPIRSCGRLVERMLGYNMYQFVWNDAGGDCQLNYFTGSYFYFINNHQPGDWFDLGCHIGGHFRDGGEFTSEFHNWNYRVVQMDAIRGDVTGDGLVTWADVDSMDMWILHEELWNNLYRQQAPNPAWGRSFGSMPEPIHAFLTAQWIVNPNHPWVAGLGIGDLMSVPQGSVASAPAEPDIVGRALTVSSPEGQAAIVNVIGSQDGQFWSSGSWINEGQAVFQLPEWAGDSSVVQVEAWSWINPLDYEADRDLLMVSDYSLSQNYPNPFNPTTQIPFELSRYAPVRLEIYNMLGQKVATLLDGQVMEPGQHSVRFDGSSLASGVYIYALAAGNFQQAQKMVLMK